MSKPNVYQAITDRMITALQSGTVPWHKPWSVTTGRPMRMSANEPYKGSNVLLLGLTAAERGYTSKWWGTFRQIKELGGNVREGQNKANGCGATYVSFWTTFNPRDAQPDPETGELRKIPTGTLIPVFNADQCEGLPEKYYPQPGQEPEKIESAETVIGSFLDVPAAPKLEHDGGNRAYYQIDSDSIHLPKASSFNSADRMYAALFHELTHSTGHPSRLDIPESGHNHFGDAKYSREELRAEMGAAFLAAETGLDAETLFDNSAAYIGSWLKELTNDPKLVVSAASAAQKACDLVMEPSRELQKQAQAEVDFELEVA